MTRLENFCFASRTLRRATTKLSDAGGDCGRISKTLGPPAFASVILLAPVFIRIENFCDATCCRPVVALAEMEGCALAQPLTMNCALQLRGDSFGRSPLRPGSGPLPRSLAGGEGQARLAWGNHRLGAARARYGTAALSPGS